MSTLYWPFDVDTVSEWPGQRPGSYHVGTDFAVPQGTPLRATIDGVIKRWESDGFGAYVLDIFADDGLLVRNGHLSRMDVVTGQRVTAGDIIGLTGGKRGTPGAGMSTGPHLHWELRRDRLWSGGAWIDPRTLNPPPSVFGQQPTYPTKEDDMRVVNYKGNLYTIGQQFIHHVTDAGEANLVATIFGGGVTEINDWGAKWLSASLGIPETQWHRTLGGGTWSAINAIPAGSSKPGTVDVAAIAKAVNDDVSRRMNA